jgi:hypothetical protein
MGVVKQSGSTTDSMKPIWPEKYGSFDIRPTPFSLSGLKVNE